MSLGSLFGKQQPMSIPVPPPPSVITPPPVIEPPPTMPTPDDEAIKKARRRSLTRQYSRRGRASTILSDGAIGETLG